METDIDRPQNIAERLQNIVIDYTRPQKVGHGLQNLQIDYKRLQKLNLDYKIYW